MKYNPKVNEDAANLEGFTAIHPLAPEEDVQGCLEVVAKMCIRDRCSIWDSTKM